MRKVFSVLLACSLLLSLLTFASSAEAILCDIRIEIDGGGSVSDGENVTFSNMSVQYPRGTTITLTAAPEADSDGNTEFAFLYWKNKETQRILSFDPQYTFAAATYMTLEAVFDFNDETAALEGVHRVVYLSEGDNVLYTESIAVGDTTYFSNMISETKLFVGGKTWLGWDHTPEEVAADPGTVYVRPVYSNTASHVITSIVNGTSTVQQVKYGETATITCPNSLNGQSFSYWIVRGTDEFHKDIIASYFRDYSFIAVQDVTLEAVYGDGSATGVALRVVGDTPDFENTSIRFAVERSVTSGYTILQTGAILTKDVRIGSSESSFVINESESAILKGTSKSTASSGTYTVTLGKWYATTEDGITYYPLVFARGYAVIRDRNGNTSTYYSDIYCADYINRSFIGQIEGDNYDDPFG